MNAKSILDSIEMHAEYMPTPFNLKGGMLEYKIKLIRNGSEYSTPYKMGYGHIIGWKHKYSHSMTVDVRDAIIRLVTGKKDVQHTMHETFKRPSPDKKDLIYSLVQDLDILNYRPNDFESWASDCGFDTDSLSAFRNFEAWYKQALIFRDHFLKPGEAEAIQQAMEDEQW